MLPAEILLQIGKQEVVAGGDIWRVRRVIELLEAGFVDSGLGNTRLVDGGVIVQQQHTTRQLASPLLLQSLVQATDQQRVIFAIDRLLVLQVIDHQHAFAIPKYGHHYLAH